MCTASTATAASVIARTSFFMCEPPEVQQPPPLESAMAGWGCLNGRTPDGSLQGPAPPPAPSLSPRELVHRPASPRAREGVSPGSLLSEPIDLTRWGAGAAPARRSPPRPREGSRSRTASLRDAKYQKTLPKTRFAGLVKSGTYEIASLGAAGKPRIGTVGPRQSLARAEFLPQRCFLLRPVPHPRG